MSDAPRLDVEALLPFLARALEEDHAQNDRTARAVVPADRQATGDVFAKAEGVVCGLELAEPTFRFLDPDAEVTLHLEDGQAVTAKTRVLTVTGQARAILSAERTVLDVLGHLSGVSTLTRAYVQAANAPDVKVLDTRKTTPGWRDLEKYAVRCGGGSNHRLDLADAAMVKENHLYAAFGTTGPDSIREATARCRKALPEGKALYVEVENLAELDAAVEAGADVVMLDAFDLETIREAVARVSDLEGRQPTLEVTGGVTLENIDAYAQTGVSRISIGRLTHSAPQLDLHLRIRHEG